MNFTPLINGHFLSQKLTGVQRYAYELLNQFDKLEYKYELIKPPSSLRSKIAKQIWMQTVLPCKLPSDRLFWSPTNIGPVMHQSHVLTLHDIADQLYPQWFNKRYFRWRKLILPKLLDECKGVITVSKYSKKTICKYFKIKPQKVKVIYNGVNHIKFYPLKGDMPNLVKRKYNIRKPYFLSVSSLDPRKNVTRLIKAWNALPLKYRKEFELLVIGAPNDNFAFDLNIELDESVRFLGYVDDEYLHMLYSKSYCFIYPSLFEGFGMPVLEAMSCGTPVITSNTTSLKEIAVNIAQTVNPESIEEIRTAILNLIIRKEERVNMINKGLKWAEKFTWKKTAIETYKYLSKFS